MFTNYFMDLFVDFTIKQLISNNVYMGHRQTITDVTVFSQLLGDRNGMSFFDARRILLRLKPALNFIARLTVKRSIVLFNNPDRRIMSVFVLQKFSDLIRYFYFTKRKLPGILTNFFRLRAGLSTKFKTLQRFPVMVFSVNLYDHHIASEAAILGLPVLNIYDSNTNFYLNYSYNVPGNDDSFVAHRFYYNVVCRAILKGLVRFHIYRRIKIFKKIKKVLLSKKRVKFLHYYKLSKGLFLPFANILDHLFFRVTKTALRGKYNNLLGFSKRHESPILSKTSPVVSHVTYSFFSADSKKSDFLDSLRRILVDEGNENIDDFLGMSDKGFMQPKVLGRRFNINQKLGKTLMNKSSKLFSFSFNQRILNSNILFSRFVHIKKVRFFKLLKKFLFFRRVKGFFVQFKNRHQLGFFSFFKFYQLVAYCFYRYISFLYLRRFRAFKGNFLNYVSSIRKSRRRYRNKYKSYNRDLVLFSSNRNNYSNRGVDSGSKKLNRYDKPIDSKRRGPAPGSYYFRTTYFK